MTEKGWTAQLTDEFRKRNFKLPGLSTERVEEYNCWVLDVNETRKTTLAFPIVADAEHKIDWLLA